MNNFNEKQNTNEMLDLLKLQRYRYNQVSKIAVLNFILSVLLPIIISLIVLFLTKNNYIVFINFIGAFCVLLCIYLNFLIKKMKDDAAQIQYVFDINLFDFKQNIYISNYSIADLLTRAKNPKVQKIREIEEWYKIPKDLDKKRAIFLCQKQNINWDKNLRKKYLSCIIIMCVLSIFIILSIAIIKNVFIDQFFSYILLFMPIISYAIIFIFQTKNNLKEQSELYSLLKKNKSQKNISEKELRSIEEKIHYYRKELVKIPNWFFSIFKKSIQEDINKDIEVFNKQNNL